MSTAKKTVQNIINLGILLFSVWFLYTILKDMLQGISYPSEYREAVNIEMIRYILSGKNPYALSALQGEVPGPVYQYPFGYCYFVAAVAKLIPIHIVVLSRWISFLCIVFSAVLVSVIVHKKTKNLFYTLLAFPLIINCHWRGGFAGAMPDDFAFFIMILLLYLMMLELRHGKEILAAFLVAVLFYTKQYFVVIAVPLFIYFLFQSKKKALLFSVSGILMAVLSMTAVSIFMPTYWVYSFYFFKSPAEAYLTVQHVLYSIAQYRFIIILFFAQFLMIGIYVLYALFKKKRTALQWNFKNLNAPLIHLESDSYEVLIWSGFWFMGLVVGYFGLNMGAYGSYFLQLLCPFVVILAAICTTKLFALFNGEKTYVQIMRPLATFGIAFLSLFFIYSKMDIIPIDEEIKGNWQKAYGLIEEYDGDIVYSPLMAYIGFEKDAFVYDTGHVAVTRPARRELYEQDEKARKQYPIMEDIFKVHAELHQEMQNKAVAGEYTLITRVSGMDYVFSRELLEKKYQLLETIPLASGNHIWPTEFWVLK